MLSRQVKSRLELLVPIILLAYEMTITFSRTLYVELRARSTIVIIQTG